MDKDNNALDKWFEDNYLGYGKIKNFYHYTSVDALESLTREDGDLRLTHYKFLNDRSEFDIGRQSIIEILQDLNREHNEKYLQEMQGKEFEEGFLRKTYLTPWIASFSAERDSLYQWIAYTPRDKGGIALSLNAQELLQKVQMANTSYGRFNCDAGLVPCIYLVPCFYKNQDADRLSKFVDFLFGTYLPDVQSRCKTEEGRRTAFYEVVMIGSSLIKHDAFHFEQEWRIVFLPNQEEQMKAVMPYGNKLASGLWGSKHSFGHDVKEVMLSPHGDRDALRKKVNWIKDMRSLSFEPSESGAPYAG